MLIFRSILGHRDFVSTQVMPVFDPRFCAGIRGTFMVVTNLRILSVHICFFISNYTCVDVVQQSFD